MKNIYAFIMFLALMLQSGISAANDGERLRILSSDPGGIVSINVFNQNISFLLPENWKYAYKEEKGQPVNFVLLEFIPEDEGITSWNDFFSIQVANNIPAEFTPQLILRLEAKTIAKICRDKTIFQYVQTTEAENGTSHAFIGCANSPFDLPTIGIKKGMAELGYYTVIKKQNNIYIFKRSIRTKTITSLGELKYLAKKLEKLNSDFSSIKLSTRE